MKNKKAEAVIKRLDEASETVIIKVLGDEQNKAYAFSILMRCQAFGGFKKNEYSPIEKGTLRLLDEANIKYKIIK